MLLQKSSLPSKRIALKSIPLICPRLRRDLPQKSLPILQHIIHLPNSSTLAISPLNIESPNNDIIGDTNALISSTLVNTEKTLTIPKL